MHLKGLTETNLVAQASSIEDVVIHLDHSVEKGTFNYTTEVNAVVIAISTQGRRGLAHFFSGIIREDIVNHSKPSELTSKIS